MVLQMFVGAWLLAAASPSACPSPSPGALAAPAPALQAQSDGRQSAPAAPAADGDSYYQFVLGRHLESEGDVEGAIKAFTDAARLDPKSAEILAELASLYARDNRFQDALKTADRALANNPNNVSAHRILGLLFGSLARVDDGAGPLSGEAAGYAAKAAEHLEAARKRSEIGEPGLDLMLARIYYRTNAFDKAITVLSHMVIDEPGRPEPVNLLVQSYQQAGRPDEAIRLLEATVAEQPQFYATLGELYERKQAWKEAAAAYERAMLRNPKSLELRTRLAVALLSSGDDISAGRAIDVLQQVRQESPADGRVLYLLAQAQRTVGKVDESEQTARELLKASPGSLTGPYALALALEAKQQYRAVIDTLTPAVSQPPSRGAGLEITPLYVHLGFAYLELGDADKALEAFQRARAASPLNPAIDLYIVQAQISAHRFDEAIALARKARASGSANQRMLRLEADALRQSGKGPEGEALLVSALKEHPDDQSAYLALAEFQAQIQQYEPALRVLDQAAARFPGDLAIAFQAGSVLERQKRFAEAERKFREVIAKDPLHAQALNYLGYMLAERGERLDESIGYIKRALQTDPYNGAYLDSLGWAYFRQNKFDLAEASLRKAAEQRVRDSAVQDHFGDLLFKLGRYQDAVTAWQRALQGDGDQVDRGAIDRKVKAAREKAQKQ
jgi:tetratricopeptide (TPR) repeat protein